MSASAGTALSAVRPVAFLGWPRWATLSSTAAFALGVVGYRILVDVAYQRLVAIPFAYQGFVGAPTLNTLLVSWLFLLALLPLVVRVLRSEALSARITAMLVFISLVPTTTLIAHDPRYPLPFIVLIFVYWLLFLLACAVLPAIQPFRRPLRSEVPHLAVLATLSATVLFISWRYTGFRLHFGLLDIYALRVEARGFQVAAIIGYFATFADNLLPILIAYYLRRRWYLIAILIGVVILFNFGISAGKQQLFLLAFALASVAIRENTTLNWRFLAFLGAVIVAALLEQRVFGTIFLGSFSLYRVFAIPSHLHWVHYDFFQTRELLYLTQSALKFFFASPYVDNVQFLGAEHVSGEFGGRANNGLFSDGYMNFGAVSVLFYPVLLVVVLKLVEGAARGLSSSVHFILAITLSFVLLGLPLPTAILSAGIGLLVILLPSLPRRDGGASVGVPA